MNTSSLLLLGIGRAGSSIARGVSRAFGPGLRFTCADTDALTGQPGGDFILLGGERLAGRGTGCDLSLAKIATEDSVSAIDPYLEGVNVVALVAGLGGGTGTAASLAILQHLRERGVTTILFATTPFLFEGDERHRNARSMQPILEENADASFFIPLDRLISGEDNMELAMSRAVDTMASGITLFWRLIEKPGYIAFDSEKMRAVIKTAGHGTFATISRSGFDRAGDIVEELKKSNILSSSKGRTKSVVTGILAGDDLRLSEVGTLANGVKEIFGTGASYELATVNDESTFSGRISVVVMAFDSTRDGVSSKTNPSRHGGVSRNSASRKKSVLGYGNSKGIFAKTVPTLHNGEDLDTPTYLRQNITLEL